MSKQIDWQDLSSQLKTNWNGFELGGSALGCQALELILGEAALREAADCFILGTPGFALAESVLKILRPRSVMKYCYEIYKSDRDIIDRRMALVLLMSIADKSVLNQIEDFLNDEDSLIQNGGAQIIENLVHSGFVEINEIEYLMSKAEKHSNEGVREKAKDIRRLIA